MRKIDKITVHDKQTVKILVKALGKEYLLYSK